jgi:ankyrin repeat protein
MCWSQRRLALSSASRLTPSARRGSASVVRRTTHTMSSAGQVTCSECGATILAATAARTGGLCMACKYPLSDICAEQNPNPADQRRRLITLLKSGADIHATDKNGVTALHHAVRFRSPTAVRTLIEHGANVNQVCRRSGSTPLHRAVTTTGAPSTAGKRQESIEIIRLLIAAGADPSITNKSGRKPADYVKDEAIKALLKTQRHR